MNDEEREFERKRLRLQAGHLMAAFFAPIAIVVAALITVMGVLETIRSNERDRAEAAEVQADAQRAIALAQSGELICVPGGFGQWETLFPTDVETLLSPSPGNVFYSPSPSPKPFRGIPPIKQFCKNFRERPPSLLVQRELIRELAEHPKQRAQIIAMWRSIYKVEGWIDRIEAALRRSAS